jgi:hypothetical protein
MERFFEGRRPGDVGRLGLFFTRTSCSSLLATASGSRARLRPAKII